MQLMLDLQTVIESASIPGKQLIERWLKTILELEAERSGHSLKDEYELTIRVVERFEIQKLNLNYRNQDKPTNVLSFPFEAPSQVPLPLLGDLVICHPIVVEEAEQQDISLEAHWAHMVVHGTLHLLDYDHIEDEQAETMEGLEILIMQCLGYANPYD